MPTAILASSSSTERIRAVKTNSFRYTASNEFSSLFEDFRLMCNDAIRTAIEEKPKSRFDLVKLAYQRLKEYGLHTHYIYSACEVAYSAYKSKNRKKIPRFTKTFLKLDNESYRLNHLLLRIPVTPRHFIFLMLEGSERHLSYVDNPSLKKGSITITEKTLSISFSKEVALIEPSGFMGVDINERNVTVSASDGYERQLKEFSEIAEIKERYREIRANIGRVTRVDKRIAKGLLAKYGRKEKNRTVQRIHKVTREIIDYANVNQLGIKMERITGIRKLYRKGNGQGKSFRGRMNTWVFGEVQRQIGYKAAWLGVPVHYVNPSGTSRNCPDCGSRVAPLQDRKLLCAKCDRVWDRDDIASRNIMACAVPQARPLRGSDEKEPRRQEDTGNPLSRWGEVKPSS